VRIDGVSKRFDIQALRALAVIAVLAFHSGFLLNAGYLGVDVFFVVSGFVVTQLILRRIQAEGKLDLSEFWKKRVRRLFPGLALMVVVLTPVSLLVFPRLQEASAGLITAAAGVFSTANIAAALLEFDYFAAPSKENFMLHLWSLSVEEQFYVLWPLAFVALWGGLKIKKFAIVVALIALTSVLVWIIGSTELLGLLDRGQAFFGFFSPISRAWEFLAGALVALLPEANSRTHWSNPMSKVGWAVVLAILIFAPSEPPALNLAVLILVLGVCAILRWDRPQTSKAFSAGQGSDGFSSLATGHTPYTYGIGHWLYLDPSSSRSASSRRSWEYLSVFPSRSWRSL
jgi:peptidoglycan/LPS O-acetylase OafA/YrhL